MVAQPHTKPFLTSQGLRLLREQGDVRPFLRPEAFRTRREQERNDNASHPAENRNLGNWDPLSRDELLAGRFNGETLDRLVITCDAGWGKTTNLKWLHAHLCRTRTTYLTIRLKVSEFPETQEQLLEKTLVAELTHAGCEADERRLGRLMDQLRKSGRLILLLDALDQLQPGQTQPIALLRDLIRDRRWDGCPIVLTARPYALDRHWESLFEDHQWRFAHLHDFDEPQQRLFLGKTPDGTDRYDLIPEDARPILSVPRVLEYLRDKVPNLSDLKTPSDVFFRAGQFMIDKGLNDEEGSQLGCYPGVSPPRRADKVKLAWLLLSAIAFEMVAGGDEADDAGETTEVPAANWDQAAADLDFKSRVCRRVVEVKGAAEEIYDADRFRHDLDRLPALNAAIDQGFLDEFHSADDTIIWRDRSLQEFAASYWISNFTTTDDQKRLYRRIYLPEVPATADYYWMWRFAAEMPTRARSQSWVDGMRPLYRPGVVPKRSTLWERILSLLRRVHPATGPVPKRSCEMIWRSWNTMGAYESGEEVLRDFQAEFRLLLESGNKTARRLVSSIIELPGGTFKMGSPPGLADLHPPQHDVELSGFGLSSTAVTNAQYELFDPSHLLRRWGNFDTPDATKDQGFDYGRFPVVFVSWSEAAVFCRWLGEHEGRKFSLPTEAQWEYACRAGTETAYFYGNVISPEQANFDESEINRTVSVDDDGFCPVVWQLDGTEKLLHHMHGNVTEWCEDWFDDEFFGSEAALRVGRGGNWHDAAWFCCCADRGGGGYVPEDRYNGIGFRVARVRAGLKKEATGEGLGRPKN